MVIEGLVIFLLSANLSRDQAKLFQRLQREIANARGVNVEEDLRSPLRASPHEDGRHRGADDSPHGNRTESKSLSGASGKRKYRRHPKVSRRRFSKGVTTPNEADCHALYRLMKMHPTDHHQHMSSFQIVGLVIVSPQYYTLIAL